MRADRLRSWLGPVILTLGSTLISLACLEAGLRVFTGDKYLDIDLRLRTGEIAYEPNQFQQWKRLEWDVPIRINSKGFRDVEHGSEAPRGSILALGDSFTEGYGIELSKTYSKQLEDRLKAAGLPRRVYNAGLQGRGVHDFIRVYDHFFQDEKGIDLVLMGFFIPRVVNPPTQSSQPVYAAAPDRTRWAYHIKRFLCEYSILYNFVRRALKGSPNSRLMNGLLRLGVLTTLSDGTAEHTWVNRKHLSKWTHTAEVIRDFKSRLKADGKEFVLIIIPATLQVEDDTYEHFLKTSGTDPKSIERFAFEEYLVEYSRRHGIRTLDLIPGFRKANKERPGNYYFKTDGHWNPNGHALAADILQRYLMENRLLRR